MDGILPLFAIGDDGTFVYRTGTVGLLRAGWQMVWVDREGRQTVVDTSWTFRNVVFGANAGWALSPDGSRLAIGLATEAGDNIWVKQLPTGPLVRVTFDSAAEYRPRWMPDGRTLLFSSNRAQVGLYRRPADGTGADERVLSGEVHEGQVTGDGQWLVARGGGNVNQAGGRDIGALRLGVDTALAPLVATQYDESDIALSPDGRWLAYVSDETGRPEVFLRPFPNVSDAKYQVSTRGGVAPLWSRDGRELFYVTATREMTVVPVAARAGPAPALGEARTLFVLGEDIYLTAREYYTPFDITPDGRRFIMARRLKNPAQGATRLLITLNWFGELERQLDSR
jgi:eukaryotic-like serine/threonine-protein kinase